MVRYLVSYRELYPAFIALLHLQNCGFRVNMNCTINKSSRGIDLYIDQQEFDKVQPFLKLWLDKKYNDKTIVTAYTHILLEKRQAYKMNEDWAQADLIREALEEIGISIKDTKDGYIIKEKP